MDVDTDASREQETLRTDLVTQLQMDLALACERLFVGIGSLQRDARPLPLDDEEIVGVSGAGGTSATNGVGTAGVPSDTTNAPGRQANLDSESDINATAKRMGADLRESLRRLERHIRMLPDGIVYDTSKRMGGEGVGSAEVRGLLEENKALRAKLVEAVQDREGVVRGLEERHRGIVDELLGGNSPRLE